MKSPVKWSQQDVCRLTAKQEGIWVRVYLLPFSKEAATLLHGEGCFAAGLVGWWEYVLRQHRNFRAELPSNREGEGKWGAFLFFHIQKPWWSIHMFCTAVMGMLSFLQQSSIRLTILRKAWRDLILTPRDLWVWFHKAPKRTLAGILVLPVGNASRILLYWPQLCLRLGAPANLGSNCVPVSSLTSFLFCVDPVSRT